MRIAIGACSECSMVTVNNKKRLAEAFSVGSDVAINHRQLSLIVAHMYDG